VPGGGHGTTKGICHGKELRDLAGKGIDVAASIVSTTNGIITLKISGKLRHPELAAVEKIAVEIFRQQGKMRILVLAEDFQGWERGGDWGDLSFMRENDQHMERLAIVGDSKWKDLSLIFAGKNYRECPVEYFHPEEAAQAYAWLKERGKPEVAQ
jgi:hypothetical protein